MILSGMVIEPHHEKTCHQGLQLGKTQNWPAKTIPYFRCNAHSMFSLFPENRKSIP